MNVGTITSVNPLRVRSLLLSALGLFSKGSDDGRFWVQGIEKTSDPLIGNHFGYCSIGAINNVAGFSEEEKRAARIALAKMIDKDYFAGTFLTERSYDEGHEVTFENNPYMADDLIADSNDSEDTTFETVRSWFTNAAAFLKRG